MTTTSRQPPHARQTPQGEPERQPAEPHPAAGQAKSAALASLERLAAPMLSQHHAEADLAAQAKLLKGVMDEEMQLKRMPAGRPREERAGALQNFLQRTLGLLAERQVRVGNALQRFPSRLASRMASEPAPRDELTRVSARGTAPSPKTRGSSAGPEAPRGRSASRGSSGSSASERAGRGRGVAAPRVPVPAVPPVPEQHAAHVPSPLLGKAEVFVEMGLGKYPLADEINRAYLPKLRDARTGKEVTARASLVVLPDERLVLMSSMFDQGGFGKARPGLLVATGEKVMVKETRRRQPRTFQPANRLGHRQSHAPTSRAQRDYMDRNVDNEYAMLREFGGAGAGLGRLRTSKSNYLVLGAMDDSLLAVQDATTSDERSALVRHLGPVLMRQVAKMHANKALHLDLKAANALVDYASGKVALSDFGSARRMDENGVVFRRNQPSTYPAPEIARPHEPGELLALTPASDVWSAAVGLLEMLQPHVGGDIPFTFDTFRGSAWAAWHARALPDGVHLDEDFLAATASHRFTAYINGARAVDESLTAGLLAGPLHPNPSERPTAAELARELAGPPQAQARSAEQAGSVLARKVAGKEATVRGQLEAGLAKLRERLVEDYPHLRTGIEPFA